MKRRNFFALLASAVAGTTAAAKVKSQGIMLEAAPELNSACESSAIFDNVELQDACINAWGTLDKSKYFFASLFPIVINKKAGDIFDRLWLEQPNRSEFHSEIPKVKLGKTVSQSTIDKAVKLKTSTCNKKDIDFIVNWKRLTAEGLVRGVLTSIENAICSAIMQRGYEGTLLIPTKEVIRTTVDNNIFEFKASIKSAAKTGKYSTAVLRSGMIKELTNRSISDYDEAASSLSRELGIEVVKYDAAYWSKSNGGVGEKNWALSNNTVILLKADKNVSANSDVLEYSCETPTELKLDLLQNKARFCSQIPLYSYFTYEHNPSAIEAWAVLKGFPNILKPENFKVLKLDES